MGGGGSPWDNMSYDPETNTLYFGTGNGAPWDEKARSKKGGDNLFLSSIIAVDADTGAYKWHYQTTPGDSWDFDSTQSLIQADLKIDGQDRKVIMQASKNGFFYVLDRVTGKLISAKPYVNVTWAKGIDLATGRPIEAGDVLLVTPDAEHQFRNTGEAPLEFLCLVPLHGACGEPVPGS